eukprot:scaffold558_cov111-Cylindrotheca_fusiformis.AAC.20
MSLWELFHDKPHQSSKNVVVSKRRKKGSALHATRTGGLPSVLVNSSSSSSSPVGNHPAVPRMKEYRSFPCSHHLIDEETYYHAMKHNVTLRNYPNQDATRRKERARLGISLAHKQLLRTTADQQKDCYNKDGSHVIYRKKEDYSGPQTYTSCIFLNDYDRVLAADSAGKMDIIRLPPFPKSSIKTTSRTKLGTPLLQELQIVQPSLDANASSALKLKSLDDGSSFVVGMATGNYHIVDTERSVVVAGHSHLQSTRTTNNSNQHTPLLPSVDAYTVHGPKRCYHRDRTNPHFSLTRMLQSFGGQSQTYYESHDFRPVYGWNENKHRVATPIAFACDHRKVHSNQAMWDFQGNHPSSLLAAHVDAEHDCFSLWDVRHRPTVVIDTTSPDFAPKKQDNISSCAFVSPHCLATSHVEWSSPSSSCSELQHGILQQSPNATASSCVKLWDLRMLNHRKPLSAISIVPSFPKDTTLGAKPTILNLSNSNKTLQNLAITRIQTPTTSNASAGTMIVTAESSLGVDSHFLVDLASGGADIVRTVPSVSHDNNATTMAVADSHYAMACLGTNGTTLQIHNLISLRRSFSKSTAGRKRSSSSSSSQSKDTIWTPVLKDRHGLETQLSCIAMNYTGSSVLGGSIDGDLFLWRGS